jgi:CDP-2,3-bis-(O-geranylgeranyl)-sn-glycerol synthase
VSAAALWLLVVVANAAPLLAARRATATPLDFGLVLPDGRRLFGAHKSWRGLMLSLICTGICAPLLGLPVATGLIVAALAMLGDMLASLTKRRLGIAPGGMAPLLDPLPESLLPLIVVGRPHLAWATIALLALAFMALDLALRALHSRLHRT